MDKREIKIYWDRESRTLPICFCYDLPVHHHHMVSKGSMIEITCIHSGSEDEVEMLRMLYPDIPSKKIRCLIEGMYQVWEPLHNYLEKTLYPYYWPDILDDMVGIDLEKFKVEMEAMGIAV